TAGRTPVTRSMSAWRSFTTRSTPRWSAEATTSGAAFPPATSGNRPGPGSAARYEPVRWRSGTEECVTVTTFGSRRRARPGRPSAVAVPSRRFTAQEVSESFLLFRKYFDFARILSSGPDGGQYAESIRSPVAGDRRRSGPMPYMQVFRTVGGDYGDGPAERLN